MKYLLFTFLLGLAMSFTSCTSDEDIDGGGPMPDQDVEQVEEPDGSDLVDAPTFSLKTYDDMDLKSSAYEGKVLVVFFFGNSCPPCIGVGPDIEDKLNKDFSDKSDYAIVGIDQWDGNAASVESFQSKTGVSFPLGLMGSDVAKEYGTTYDRLLVVNKEGKIAYKGNSIAANNLDDVIDLVKTMVD